MLARIDGTPLIELTVRSLTSGGVERVVVVLAPGEAEIALPQGIQVAVNPDPSRGMFSSIQEALRVDSGDPLIVLPGDMPFVSPETVRQLLATYAARPSVVSPRYRGKRGHPVVLPPHLRDEILDAEATTNLHEVLKRHAASRVDIDVADSGVTRDVDTPADLMSEVG
jgi:molybdenum cofactor cytidylyltransferase